MAGCDGPIPEHLRFTVGEISIDRCPAFFIVDSKDFIDQCFEWYNWRDKGFLPMTGGYAEQSNKFVEACNYLDFLYAEKMKRESKR